MVLKIAGIGVLLAVITQLLKQTGREDIAMLASLAGLVIVLSMIISSVAELFTSVQQVFQLY